MKKILFIIVVSIIVFCIYLGLKDKKVYYLSIGDYNLDMRIEYNYSNYIHDYLEEIGKLEKNINILDSNYRVVDLINMIENNEKIDNKNIKNILIKSDLLTLSIGYNDIVSKIDKYDYNKVNKLIDNYINDLEKLFNLLKKYCKEDIIMIGYYNIFEDVKYDSSIKYLNRETKELSDKYNIHFIDIEEVSLYSYQYHPTNEGEHIIFNKIRKVIDSNILK